MTAGLNLHGLADGCLHLEFARTPVPLAQRRSEVCPSSSFSFTPTWYVQFPPQATRPVVGRSRLFPSLPSPQAQLDSFLASRHLSSFIVIPNSNPHLLHQSLPAIASSNGCHLTCLNHPLAAATATDLSITHSPTSRYESIHFLTSLLSVILSVWKLGLGPRWALLTWCNSWVGWGDGVARERGKVVVCGGGMNGKARMGELTSNPWISSCQRGSWRLLDVSSCCDRYSWELRVRSGETY